MINLKDARNYGVELKGGKWFDEDAVKYYPPLAQDKSYDFIIGHAPYTAKTCLALKEFYKNKNESLKVILMFHALPKDVHGDIDDEVLLNWLSEADIVSSIGKPMEDELLPYIAALEPEKRPVHKMYLPTFPSELITHKGDTVQENVKGTQHICMIMRDDEGHLDKADLNFPLAVTAAGEASAHLRDFEGIRIRLSLLVANEDEKDKWKHNFEEILRTKYLNDTGLSFQVETPHTIEKMKIYLRKANIFLLPQKQNSPLFGTETLAAIAAGVPVLVSKYSGLASLLGTIMEDEPVVGRNMSKVNVQSWKERIIEKLLGPAEAQKAANRLRERLVTDANTAQTHLDFGSVVADSVCIQLEMEIEINSAVSEDQIKAAIQFGIESPHLKNTKKYITAFLKRLLLEREKGGKNFQGTHLKSAIIESWQEVLSILEDKNRQLINIENIQSFRFTLFCPTDSSLQQLQDERWKTELQGKVDNLLNILGDKARSRIRTVETLEDQMRKITITDSDSNLVVNSEPLQDRELSLIAQAISAKNMKKIALDYLKLTQVEFDNTEFDNKDSAYNQTLALLTLWRNKNSENARKELEEILRRAATEKGIVDYDRVKKVLH